MRVSKEKLGKILRESRRRATPKIEGLQTDFEGLVNQVKKLFDDHYNGRLEVLEGTDDEEARAVACVATFARAAYRIIGVKGEGDEKIWRWTNKLDVEGGWQKAERAYEYTLNRIFSRMEECSTDDRELFFALQNLYDKTMEIEAGNIARILLVRMDRLKGVDLDVFAQDLLSYSEMTRKSSLFEPLPKIFRGGEESAFFRIMCKNIEEATRPDETGRKAQEWLDRMDLPITVQKTGPEELPKDG